MIIHGSKINIFDTHNIIILIEVTDIVISLDSSFYKIYYYCIFIKYKIKNYFFYIEITVDTVMAKILFPLTLILCI